MREEETGWAIDLCPFCGGKPYVRAAADSNSFEIVETPLLPEDKLKYFMSCKECGAKGPVRDTPVDARLAWEDRLVPTSTIRSKHIVTWQEEITALFKDRIDDIVIEDALRKCIPYIKPHIKFSKIVRPEIQGTEY